MRLWRHRSTHERGFVLRNVTLRPRCLNRAEFRFADWCIAVTVPDDDLTEFVLRDVTFAVAVRTIPSRLRFADRDLSATGIYPCPAFVRPSYRSTFAHRLDPVIAVPDADQSFVLAQSGKLDRPSVKRRTNTRGADLSRASSHTDRRSRVALASAGLDNSPSLANKPGTHKTA